ncbi:glycosyltransferase family 4 protein [Cryomorphaceae bacterium 1068]|nr:glycosyltransferase family 4 protein [Cryomorphaceae bacterium 1068]
MHIAVITDGITPFVTGGMQRHSFHLVKNLLRKGVKITLVHCVCGNDSFPKKEKIYELMESSSEALEIHTLRFPQMKNVPGHYLRESYQYSCNIYELLKDKWGKFDFIYCKGFTSWCLLEQKKKGKHMAPVGVKFHGYEMFQKNKNIKGKIEQFMLRPPVVFINRNADAVFSYGGEINGVIEKIGVDPDKIVSIGSGIDDSWLVTEPKKEQGTRRFLFIGRNEKRKGLDDLKALSGLISTLPIEFHFVGPIPKLKQIKSPNCVYHGEVTDSNMLRDTIDTCQVLVVPSHSEGMPNVILEAMSRGLAILATSVGAVPMMVSDSNGRLIPSHQRAALSGVLTELAEMDSADLMKLREKSLNIISENYLWSAIAQKNLNAIEKITFTLS